MNHKSIKFKSGAASLFIVFFSVILFTIIALGFIKIVLRGGKTSLENNLSQNAYDSAIAGVEDAKRALSKYVKLCANNCPGTNCSDYCSNISNKKFVNASTPGSGDCDVVSYILNNSEGGAEEKIEGGVSGAANSKTDQAYTCVKVTYETNDYIGELKTQNDEVLIPLRSVAQTVRRIRLNWFSKDDLSQSNHSALNLTTSDEMKKLSPADSWPLNRPPILVANVFHTSRLEDYDIKPNVKQATWTLYLAPSSNGIGAAAGLNLALDTRLGADASQAIQDLPLVAVRCQSDLKQSRYACSAELVTEPIPANSRNHFLRLSKRYFSRASFQVEMLNEAGNIVKFAGVQPIVDSNGRASDFFRRVEARVDAMPINNDSLPLPNGLELAKGDFCKGLSVTDQAMGPDCE